RRTLHSADLDVTDVVFGESLTGRISVDAFDPTAPHAITPPMLTASAPALVDDVNVRVTGSADDADGVADVWIRVLRMSSAPLQRKVFALTGTDAPPHQALEATVPLWPGANLIEVVARDTRGARAIARTIVLRTLPGSPFSTEPGMR
ncbi:MAG: hypothetical protein JWM82_4370, partial [Myxococcales bacterium]|nr:hypothetical protein [Myxococcales bacterium]